MDMFGPPADQTMARANALLKQGRHTQARGLFESVLAEDSDSVPALAGLAQTYMETPDHHKAPPLLKKITELDASNANHFVLLSRALALQGEIDDATQALEQARAIDPDHRAARLQLANLRRTLGEFEESYDLLKDAVESGEANMYEMIAFARVAHRFEGLERSIEMTRDISSYDGIAPHFTWGSLFLLSGFLDKAGRYGEAFEAAARGNALRRKPYEIGSQLKRFDAMKMAWTPDAVSAIPSRGSESDTPVFVVGMPRSGTTLVERIIGAHPDAYPGGERHEIVTAAQSIARDNPDFLINPPAFDSIDLPALAEDALRSMRHAAPDARRIVDKTPTNGLRLPLMAMMFPKATFIRLKRDPRDTCLSCFLHAFTGSHPYADDLRDLGQFLPAYESLIDHFAAALGLNVLTVPYEGLVGDQEGWSRKIIEHCGLDWHEDCLRFHEMAGAAVTVSNEQVREKVYTSSVGRWRNYEKHLAPLLETLGDHSPD